MRTLLFLLAGCPAVFEGQYQENVRDLDGDGFTSDRFGGPDCRDDDPTVHVCDADGDGELSLAAGGLDCDDDNAAVRPGAIEVCNSRDDDCDGLIDNQDSDLADAPATAWRDRDGDGAGDPDAGLACQEFTDPTNPATAIHSDRADDCDDADPTINPQADERCDGFDNDCDGVVDDVGLWLRDQDRDGYGEDGTQAVGSCVIGPDDAVASIGGDCDDQDASQHPGAVEIPYDGVDSNCNGGLDDWDADFDGYVPGSHWAAAQAANAALPAADRWALLEGDCDDTDPRRNDGEAEVCDGVDNDCDGAVDVDDLDSAAPTDELLLRAQVSTWYVDQDGDGGFGTAVLLCPAAVVAGVHAPDADDCYDGGSVPPGYVGIDPATVFAGQIEACDGVDNDCDGVADRALASFPGSVALFQDQDGDGYGAAPRGYGCQAEPEAQLVTLQGDCNDVAPNAFPGAPEICGDAIRQDCTTADIFDCDGDGFQGSYVGGGDGSDCVDDDEAVNPGVAIEVCDGLDNDCDGLTDSADTDNLQVGNEPLWFVDDDGDGYGVDDGSGVQQCDRPVGRALDAGDCDDQDVNLSPATLWYADRDGDGFGNPTETFVQCLQPSGVATVRISGDCADLNSTLNPSTVWSLDEDGDGFGAIGSEANFCSPPATEPWVMGVGSDCDDADNTRNPSRPEIPGDGIDNDCDGVTDGSGGVQWYPDLDGDGFGDPAAAPTFTWSPGLVADATDCDDTRSAVHPGAQVELCDGLDNNCDGLSIAGNVDVSNPWQQVFLPDDGAAVYLLENALGQPTLDLVVQACGPVLPVAQLDDGQGQLFDLVALESNLLITAATCADGAPAALYARDADGDELPSVDRVSDLALEGCGDPVPAGFIAVDLMSPAPFDCDPRDPARTVEVQLGEYADEDEDGAVGVFSNPGACVEQVYAAPGEDCNDRDPGTNGRQAFSPVEVPMGALDDAVRGCDRAELRIRDDDALDLDALANRPNLELLIAGQDGLPQVALNDAAPGSIAGLLQFHGVQLVGPALLTLDGQLAMEDVQSQDVAFDVDSGRMDVWSSTLDLDGTGTLFEVADGAQVHLETSVVRGGDPAARLAVVEGDLIFTDSRIEAFDPGIQVDGGQLRATDVVFEDVEQPVTHGVPGGSSTLERVQFRGSLVDPGFAIGGGQLECDGCFMDFPDANSTLITSGEFARVELVDSTIRGGAGAVALQQGDFYARNSDFQGGGNGPTIENLQGVLTLDDCGVGGGGSLGVLAGGGALETRMSGLDLALPPTATGLEILGGRTVLSDLSLGTLQVGLRLNSPQAVRIDDLRFTGSLNDDGGARGILVLGPTEVDVDGLSFANLSASSGTLLQVQGSARLEVRNADVDGNLGLVARTSSFGHLVIEDSRLRNSGAVILQSSVDYPTLTVRRSRLLTPGSATLLQADTGTVDVEQTLLFGPNALMLVDLADTQGRFDRVTLYSGTGAMPMARVVGPPPQGSRMAFFGPTGRVSGACDFALSALEESITTTGESCPGGLYFTPPAFSEWESTYLVPSEPFYRTYFGETAIEALPPPM